MPLGPPELPIIVVTLLLLIGGATLAKLARSPGTTKG
jgi:hypothetical protein